MGRYAHLAYTESVRQVQQEQGSALAARRRLAEGDEPERMGDAEAAFIGSRDGFYLASVSETGWPYVQFRGGPPGFVHVLDDRTLGYADVRGNRQYITTGNVRADGRVALFFMDYPRQARLKIFGHAHTRATAEDPHLTERLSAPRTDGNVERLMLIRVEGFNWNCHQHITPRYSEAELARVLAPFRARMAELEEENRVLRARVGEV
ncbi:MULTISPECIES: pyridoxamine 5'-phosphate oxidase family protein [Streptomycetaceae]|uniref:Putative pyridoxine 5-phosphate oxidase n=1 Tax=Streptantibioticus cattleyicolor (strain ATCC 35852 / DSM 46488 / JCM 4925 / NBRC 14057 / NRRL 8057) TaxID=1003195 RepID=F8JRE7_STREN|nr:MULTISPECIES: pyridoxamine 5'-phosphate oxidase family protein [Streptomycetaceae]AEW96646.1 putative pyridoxine 5-phosphate oxidase [Streptantibioticus cattleyicolor NRRL 8057 = DSM 46488]MYS61140.1 pyridoxamine 5-phosphate oxidase [Streptomyces sp. SID5468]CCB76985.1 putative pyridoxine 5-phosphate oxidase [Streptantibioticus cattleyicolor NRRL 8057 = DSM 46488]